MSFDIALSGINSVNAQLDTISNNIANSGTYGFKSSRVNFTSTYAGTQSTGSEVGSLTQSIDDALAVALPQRCQRAASPPHSARIHSHAALFVKS